ncbi:Ferritin [Sergentomyia squamirostris]
MKIFVVFAVIALAALGSCQGPGGSNHQNKRHSGLNPQQNTLSVQSTKADEEHCYDKTKGACDSNSAGVSLEKCNALYSGFHNLQHKLGEFSMMNMQSSYEYLLLSTHFSDHVMSRPGFSKKYRELSDRSWEQTIDLIKHITKRGGTFNFDTVKDKRILHKHTLEMNELQSLAAVLENEKFLALFSHDLHHLSSHSNHQEADKKHYDPEIAHYMEEKFLEDQAETIRKYSGYVHDLKHIMNKKMPTGVDAVKGLNVPLGVYLFDEYLQKQ